MNIYLVQYDSVQYYVEAGSMSAAIELWKPHIAAILEDDVNEFTEPDSVALVHDDPCIRSDEISEAKRVIVDLIAAVKRLIVVSPAPRLPDNLPTDGEYRARKAQHISAEDDVLEAIRVVDFELMLSAWKGGAV